MMKVLVTGAKGQVGSEIQELSCKYSYKFLFTGKEDLDITDTNILQEFILKHKIDTIINCAAYTAVDKAEEEETLADEINHLAVKNLVVLSKRLNIKLVHISTDYVFDGKNYKPYKEEEFTNPKSIYGKTKLAGEKVMIENNLKNSLIIRTSWVYGFFGSNFVKTMLRLGKQKEFLGVVYDQVGSPTYAKDLAKTILDILPLIKNETTKIYHYSNEGVLSWYDFAKEIMRMAKLECKINPIETSDFPTPAKRPHYSVLNKTKIKEDFAIDIPYWKDGLDDCLKRLKERR